MDRIITLTPEQVQEIKRLLVEQDQQVGKALRQQLEWRFFLILLEAYCAARHWEVEYDTPDDDSVAIFADTDCGGRTPANAWHQPMLLPESPTQ